MKSKIPTRARCLAIVAGLVAAGVRSRAQNFPQMVPHANCTASDLIGYDFKAEPLGSGLWLHWSVSPFNTVSFEVLSTASEVGWLSIAFSADGNMIGSDAVVGAGGLVLEYNLGSKTLPVQSLPTTEESISPFSDQEITNAVLERVGNNTSMSFTRPTSPEGVGKQPLFLESGDHVTLLWAAGPEDTFGYHFLGRGAFTVDLLCADSQTVVDVNQPFETPDPAIVPTAAGSGLPFTEVPTMSPLDVLLFTVSPTPAPTSPQPPQPADGSNTSGALPGLLQAGGGFIGLHIGFARAMAFGLFAVGVSLCI